MGVKKTASLKGGSRIGVLKAIYDATGQIPENFRDLWTVDFYTIKSNYSLPGELDYLRRMLENCNGTPPETIVNQFVARSAQNMRTLPNPEKLRRTIKSPKGQRDMAMELDEPTIYLKASNFKQQKWQKNPTLKETFMSMSVTFRTATPGFQRFKENVIRLNLLIAIYEYCHMIPKNWQVLWTKEWTECEFRGM